MANHKFAVQILLVTLSTTFLVTACTHDRLRVERIPVNTEFPPIYLAVHPGGNELIVSSLYDTKVFVLSIHDQQSYAVSATIDLPPNFVIWRMCVTEDLWIIALDSNPQTGYFLLHYQFQEDAWDQIRIDELGEIAYCKMLTDTELIYYGQRGTGTVSEDGSSVLDGITLDFGFLDIALDPEGFLWVLGIDGRIYRQTSGNQLAYLVTQRGRELAPLGGGELLILDDQAVYRYSMQENTGTESLFKAGESEEIMDAYKRGDIYWIITSRALWMSFPNGFHEISMPLGVEYILASAYDPDSDVLFVSTDEGVYSIK